MARIKKLYDRLDALEREFGESLWREFEEVSKGGRSPFLTEKTFPMPYGKRWIPSEASHPDHVQREIRSLRTKMGESPPGPVVAILAEYVAAYERALDAGGHAFDVWYGGEEKACVRARMKKLKELGYAPRRRG